MEKKILRLIDGSYHEIDTSDGEVRDHFYNNKNYTDAIINQINNEKIYDKFVSKKDKIFLDLGGNIGLFSLHISPFAERVVIVEPTQQHVQIAKKLLRKFPKIEIVANAVSNKSEKIKFFINKKNSTQNTIISPDSFFKKILYNFKRKIVFVDALTIMQIFKLKKLNQVDFCKIDIEGSEHVIMDDDFLRFSKSAIKKIYLEIHKIPNNQNIELISDHFTNLLRKYNYKVNIVNDFCIFAELS